MTFEPPIVRHCLSEMDADPSKPVLDPFCGTGTTLIECATVGFASVGMDASPMAVMASRAKTTWTIRPSHLVEQSEAAIKAFTKVNERHVVDSKAYARCLALGMIERRWISREKLVDLLALLHAIKSLPSSAAVRRLLKLCALSMCIESVANVKFGPELYHVKRTHPKHIDDLFREKVAQAEDDLGHFKAWWPNASKEALDIFQGDARECGQILTGHRKTAFGSVVCSPPYPNEHDYTRNTRIELVLGGFVTDPEELRNLKKTMLRSSTKGIYVTDNDGKRVYRFKAVRSLAKKLEEKARDKDHGFARLYPKVLLEYFGGMMRHLESVAKVLTKGARCAYVVGEQRTYLQIRIPTAEILGHLATSTGHYKVRDIETWKVRIGSTGNHRIKEHILYLEKR